MQYFHPDPSLFASHLPFFFFLTFFFSHCDLHGFCWQVFIILYHLSALLFLPNWALSSLILIASSHALMFRTEYQFLCSLSCGYNFYLFLLETSTGSLISLAAPTSFWAFAFLRPFLHCHPLRGPVSSGVLPGDCFLFLRQHSFLSHLSLSRILRIIGWVLSQTRESYSAFYAIKTSLLPKFSMAVATDWSILPNEGLQDDAVISQACHPSLHMTTWLFLSIVLRWPHQQETANVSGSSGPCLTSSNKENSVRKDFIEGFSLGEMAALFLPWVLTAGEYSCMPFGIQSSPLSFLLLKSFGGFGSGLPL